MFYLTLKILNTRIIIYHCILRKKLMVFVIVVASVRETMYFCLRRMVLLLSLLICWIKSK